jgi:CheY-like chemotaxis protein
MTLTSRLAASAFRRPRWRRCSTRSLPPRKRARVPASVSAWFTASSSNPQGISKIYSEAGHGTTVKIYLPPGTGALAVSDAVDPATIEGGTERILVVEDDSLVRRYVTAQLNALGYVTRSAADAAEALAIVEADEIIDLLFTDVIMPGGVNGRQLADQVQIRRPGSKVLFSSGYTENAIIHHGRLDAGVLLLVKPYRKSDLA